MNHFWRKLCFSTSHFMFKKEQFSMILEIFQNFWKSAIHLCSVSLSKNSKEISQIFWRFMFIPEQNCYSYIFSLLNLPIIIEKLSAKLVRSKKYSEQEALVLVKLNLKNWCLISIKILAMDNLYNTEYFVVGSV